MMKITTFWMIALIVGLTAAVQRNENGPELLKILYTNDFHGFLEPEATAPHAGGAAHMAGMVASARAGSVPTLLVDAGDVFFGAPPISQLLNGTSTNAIWNQIKYSVCVLGNHEFDKGQQVLAQRIKESGCTWLAANIVNEGSGSTWKHPSWTTPFAIRTIGAVRIGVIGVITDETPYITIRSNVKGLLFKPPVEAILRYWDEVAKQVDFVFVLAHIGMNDVKMSSTERFLGAISVSKAIAAAGKTLQLFIAAHDHQYIQPPVRVGDTLITEAGAHGKHYGFISISKNTNASLPPFGVFITETPVNDNTVPVPDPTVADMVAKYSADVEPLVELVIGELVQIDLKRNYYDENNMGDLVCDSMIWAPNAQQFAQQGADWTRLHNLVHSHPLMAQHPSLLPQVRSVADDADPVQVCFVNGGGLREDILSHQQTINITWGDTFKVMPFQNTLWTLHLTGTQLLNVLTRSASQIKGMLSSAGLNFEWWNASGTTQAGVRNVLIGGKPLVPAQLYRVVTNSFLATGGDGWGFTEGVDLSDTGIIDQDALNNYIIGALHRRVDATSIVGGRSKRITPP